MQNFRNLGVSGGGGDHFDEIPKTHIFSWFHAFWAIMRADSFARFFARRLDEKRDTAVSPFLPCWYHSCHDLHTTSQSVHELQTAKKQNTAGRPHENVCTMPLCQFIFQLLNLTQCRLWGN